MCRKYLSLLTKTDGTVEEIVLFCKNCGHENPNTAKFCCTCGTDLSVNQTVAAVAGPPPLPSAVPPVSRSWYISVAGQQSGPFLEEQLRDWISRGQVAGDALICSEGMTEWVKAADVFGRSGNNGGRVIPQCFETSMGVGGLFGRALLLMAGTLLVVPAPWVITNFYKWFVAHLQLPRVSKVDFTGNPGDKGLLCIVLALSGYIGLVKNPFFQILPLFLNPYLSLLLLRWVIGNLTADGRALPLKFTGGYWRFVGWYILIVLSMFTIIGWAWALAANLRWLCRKVEGTNTQVVFTGTGLEILWRSIVFVLSAIVIIPIPWTLHWYVRWFVRQFSLESRI